jgi:outer membrane protein assembly factor BamD (BamD/ComL family)
MEGPKRDNLLSAFQPPAETVMTPMRLKALQARLYELKTLLSEENLEGAEGARDRLARFIMLNPHSLDYAAHLDMVLEQAGEQDGLRDNILLAKAKLIEDDQRRAERLNELSREFQNTDGGMQALYELTRLNIGRYQRESNRDRLVQARNMLTSFLSLYPDSFYVEQVKKNLEDLPQVD